MQEILSIVLSIVSITLGVLAIWLSLVFYKGSSESATRAEITVAKLEALFDKFYSVTFSVMTNSYTQMQAHILRDTPRLAQQVAEEERKRADQKTDLVRSQLQDKLSALATTQDPRDEMKVLISTAIAEARKAEVEAREETIRDHILRAYEALHKQNRHVSLPAIANRLKERFTADQVATELFSMKHEKILDWAGKDDRIAYDEPISRIE